MDFTNLTSAHLQGTYTLQSFDQNGNPVGSSETDQIVADWTGTRAIIKSHEKFSFHSKCIHFMATTKGRTRPADATGTLNGTGLGTTSDTFLRWEHLVPAGSLLLEGQSAVQRWSFEVGAAGFEPATSAL